MTPANNKELGISIRLIRAWTPADFNVVTVFDRVMLSCRWLGHTFEHNPEEDHCMVCGAVRP